MLPSRLYLTFHGLGFPPVGSEAEARVFWLAPDVFRRTLHTAGDIENQNGIEIRFTFDDGNSSDYTVAFPLLTAIRRRAKFFVCGSRIGKPGYLDASQLREMAAAGMVIGCHGYAHVNWRTLSDDLLARELSQGRQAVEEACGHRVDIASAPFGELDPRVVRAASSAGFKSLFASSGGFATSATGLVPRNTIKQGFEPNRDLTSMVTRGNRAWTGVYDTARRLKYRFF